MNHIWLQDCIPTADWIHSIDIHFPFTAGCLSYFIVLFKFHILHISFCLLSLSLFDAFSLSYSLTHTRTYTHKRTLSLSANSLVLFHTFSFSHSHSLTYTLCKNSLVLFDNLSFSHSPPHFLSSNSLVWFNPSLISFHTLSFSNSLTLLSFLHLLSL